MRRAAYVGASVAAATAVVLRAFHERPNFYSATVYLGQSTACRMILLNMLLLTLGTSMYGLQRLLYGPLRAIEIEQLWDKAWYAITETALAMTTFRDEVGGYFFLMFMTLLAGKVWGWIGEGRVETLEQQPPANPKTFYARLTTSLVLSVAFDLLMARYCLRSILDQRPPRAGMMIMFVFEFVILAITSVSTLARFVLAGYEKRIVKLQTQAKIEERRREIRAERAAASAQQTAADSTAGTATRQNQDDNIEIDENEIDVPGWQEKGKWILFLDLATDFLKLVFYMGFFMVLIIFAGIPIHMFRDLFITTRSFLKRINDYLKYRNATRDMNSRYPDATAEELQRDGTCIICREEMRLWRAPVANTAGNADQQPTRPAIDERQRPKKLPCGHILHFGCLRSWLERQQVCPTCRRSVLAPDPPRQPTTNANVQQQNARGDQANANQQPGAPGHQHQPPPPQQQQQGQEQGRQGAPGINRMRTFNLGNLRLTLATGHGVNVRDALNQMQNQANRPEGQGPADQGNQTNNTTSNPSPQTTTNSLSNDLQNLERRIMQEANHLNVAQQELHLVRAMQGELARLRQHHGNATQAIHPVQHIQPLQPGQPVNQVWNMTTAPILPHMPQPPIPPPNPIALGQGRSQLEMLRSGAQSSALSAGDARLPDGLVLPEGWSLLPLQRVGPESQQTQQDGVIRQVTHSIPAFHPPFPPPFRPPFPPPSSQVPFPQTINGRHQETAPPSNTTGPDQVDSNGQLHETETNGDSTVESSWEHVAQAGETSGTTADGHDVQSTADLDAISTLLPQIPQWSNSPSNLAGEASPSHEGEIPGSSSIDQVESSDVNETSEQSAVDKGKGRAATVEDATEED